jgi:tRNA-dependent cyclodipeptide synthase
MAMRSKVYPVGARPLIQASRSYLSVSLSNRQTAAEELLLEVFRWMQKGVGVFDVIVGDYFHRHNIEDLEGLPPAQALHVAAQQGFVQAQKIQKILERIDMTSVNVKCASSISKQPGFLPALNDIEVAYQSNSDLAGLIDQGTDAFLKRFAPQRIALESARLHSRLYQLEELAVFTLLAQEGLSTNVYVGAHLPVMKAIVSGKIDGIAPALRNMQLVELQSPRTGHQPG